MPNKSSCSTDTAISSRISLLHDIQNETFRSLKKSPWKQREREMDAQLRSLKEPRERCASRMESRFYNSHDVDIPRNSRAYEHVGARQRSAKVGCTWRALFARSGRERRTRDSLRQECPKREIRRALERTISPDSIFLTSKKHNE